MQAEEEDRGAIMSNMFLLHLPLLHHHRHPKDSHSKCHHTRIPKGPYKLDTAHDWVYQPSHSLRPSKFQYSQPFIAIGIIMQIMKATEEHTKVFSSHSRVWLLSRAASLANKETHLLTIPTCEKRSWNIIYLCSTLFSSWEKETLFWWLASIRSAAVWPWQYFAILFVYVKELLIAQTSAILLNWSM